MIEEADGGTLFLDEVGEMDIGLQAKLLRFLENKKFTKLGETKERQVDIRVLAASNKDLKKNLRRMSFGTIYTTDWQDLKLKFHRFEIVMEIYPCWQISS